MSPSSTPLRAPGLEPVRPLLVAHDVHRHFEGMHAVDGVSMVEERPQLPSPLPDGADGGNAGREGNPSGTYS